MQRVIDSLELFGAWLKQLPNADQSLWFALAFGAFALVMLAISGRQRGAAASPAGAAREGLEAQIQHLIERNDYERAGDIRRSQGQFGKALALYLNSGNENKAALCYLSLKQPGHAAEVYRRMGRIAEAAHYFQMAGNWQMAAECLENAGSEREAAELYERAGDLARAAHILRGIGDAESAARLFERAGLAAEAAAALLAARGKEPGALRKAGELFQNAGETRRAAECFAGASEWERAAAMFEGIREFTLAAQAYERAEAWERAAEAYERGGSLPEARKNFERGGDVLRAAQIALRLGHLLEAGRSFYQIGSYERATETLQSVSPQSPQHRDATLLLGRIFVEKGLSERAIEQLSKISAEPPVSKDDMEVLVLLADAYERSGEPLRALNLLEQVQDFDRDYLDVADRIERLQERAWGQTNTAPGLMSDRYELRSEIGRGGMGVVHLAQDRELERPVAVKFLPSDLASQPAAVEMFRGEARAAASMNHPNIVHVYDVTVVSKRPCIVMEYVQGRTARELMKVEGSKEKKPLSARRVAEIARDICDALAYAHTMNVIHRDVKPGNIIVSNRGQAKLMDFGISKVLERNEEGMTQAKGTPQYMPPEQILGKEVDARTDLYALGISMFEILTGRRPFVGQDVVNQQLHSETPDPREYVPDVPEAMVNLIHTACRKKASERYQSAREMGDALSEFLSSSEGEAKRR